MNHAVPTKTPLTHAALIALALNAVAGSTAHAQTRGLGTQPGEEAGLSVSQYTYNEPGYMGLKATKVGVDYSVTRTFPGSWPNQGDTSFFTGELRFANGDTRYSSVSGTTARGLADWYWEARALVGTDIDMDGYVLAPYLGLGYRYLYNDLRNLTNGYRRESHYISLPIGVTFRARGTDQTQLLTTVEYVHLLRGTQKALLSDIVSSNVDASLKQRSGSGLRLKMIRQYSDWSIGPTLTYWRVGASDSGGSPLVFEPKNNTLELGLSIRRRF